MEFWKAIKLSFSNPKALFKKEEHEQGVKKVLRFLLPLAIFYVIVSMLVNLPGVRERIALSGISWHPILIYIYVFIASVIFFYIAALILSILLHLFGRLFNSKKGTDKSFSAITYGLIPFCLFGWIPYVKLLAIIYTIVLQIIGFSELQEIHKFKSALCYIFLIIVLLVLIALFTLI